MKKNKARWPYPGKVLIIDDELDEVELAVSQLLQEGVPVEYWNSRKKQELRNIRIVLLDIILAKVDDLLTGEARYKKAVAALSKIKGSPVVIILSKTSDEPQSLVSAVQTELPNYPGVIAKERLFKKDLEDPSKLVSVVSKCLQEMPIVQLVLAWEAVIDTAKDSTVQSISGDGAAVVRAFLKILNNQVGMEGVGREFADTAIRILSRYSHEGREFDSMVKVLLQILKERVSLSKETSEEVLSLLMYYNPGTERVWTGDIFAGPGTQPGKYAIVLTPACDFAQRRVSSVLLSSGFHLTKAVVEDKGSILYKKDPRLLELAEAAERATSKKSREKTKNRYQSRMRTYLVDDTGIPEHLNILRHVRSSSDFIDICFDLEEVETRPIAQLEQEGWTRICRLDTPYVEAMLQHLGKHLSRIGVPEANIPLEKLGLIAASPSK